MDIQETIDGVEKLYAAVTGTRPPQQTNGPHAPIPPEADPARHVEAQLGRLITTMDELAQSTGTNWDTPMWIPRSCMWEGEAGTEIMIDVPGVSRDQIEISLDERVLTVKGQRQPPWNASRPPTNIRVWEVPLGMFVRAFTLPRRIEADGVSAQLKDGVLAIRIARAAKDTVAQKITIK